MPYWPAAGPQKMPSVCPPSSSAAGSAPPPSLPSVLPLLSVLTLSHHASLSCHVRTSDAVHSTLLYLPHRTTLTIHPTSPPPSISSAHVARWRPPDAFCTKHGVLTPSATTPAFTTNRPNSCLARSECHRSGVVWRSVHSTADTSSSGSDDPGFPGDSPTATAAAAAATRKP